MSDPEPRRLRVPLLLVLLPLWLVASAGFGLWFYFRHEEKKELAEQARFAQAVSQPHLQDDLQKIVSVIGERNPSSPPAAANLGRAASMIEGILGPSNTGYAVRRERGPSEWPILHTSLPGKSSGSPVWVVAAYDSRPGSPGAEANASGLASVIAASQALAHDKPEHPVHFAFLPHAYDPESPVMETLAVLRRLIVRSGENPSVLCVEAMGAGDILWLTSRDTAARPLGRVEGLGSVIGAEVACLGGDFDPASLLFEIGLPAVRVSTRPVVVAAEPDDGLPSPARVAASTGRLVELIRRCAAPSP